KRAARRRPWIAVPQNGAKLRRDWRDCRSPPSPERHRGERRQVQRRATVGPWTRASPCGAATLRTYASRPRKKGLIRSRAMKECPPIRFLGGHGSGWHPILIRLSWRRPLGPLRLFLGVGKLQRIGRQRRDLHHAVTLVRVAPSIFLLGANGPRKML